MFAQADARPTRVGRTSLPSVVMDILAFRRRVQRGRSPLWRGLGGAPNPHPLRFPPGNSAGSGGRVQRERSPLWRGLGGAPNPHPLRFPPGNSAGSGGRVQRGRSPRWWGIGVPPQPPSAPLPAREFGGFRRESPERAEPSLVGVWGYPTNPYPLSFPPGNSAGSGGRVQRGRSPRWWGLGGTPPTPIRSTSRQGSGRSSAGRGLSPNPPKDVLGDSP